LSIGAVVDFLKLDRAENPTGGQVTEEDSNITMVIEAVTTWWENHMGLCILRAVWSQTQDMVKDGCIAIRRGPLVSVTSVSTIAAFTPPNNTPVALAATRYTVTGNEIYLHDYPEHRGKSSVIALYQGGLVDWAAVDVAAPSAGEIVTAQALVPDAIRLSLLNTIGHLWENREGAKAMSKYEVDAKLVGLTPPNTAMLSAGLDNVSLTGKCWR